MNRKSWKTSLAGIGSILTALGAAATSYSHGEPLNFAVLIPALISGIGLLAARDNDKTSEQVRAGE